MLFTAIFFLFCLQILDFALCVTTHEEYEAASPGSCRGPRCPAPRPSAAAPRTCCSRSRGPSPSRHHPRPRAAGLWQASYSSMSL